VLTRIDRIQLAVPDAVPVAEAWSALLGAEGAGEDRVACLAARRTNLRLGGGWVEILEPDGGGMVADAILQRGSHLFAAGIAMADPTDLRLKLGEREVPHEVEGDQVFLDVGHGLRLVLSPDKPEPTIGAVDELYEVTNLVDDAQVVSDRFADLFGLHPSQFAPIASKEYGYTGVLTLFDPDRLHRIEVIHPGDPAKTMGRFYGRFGESLYMCFAETGELPAITDRAKDLGVPTTPVGDHTLFVHPGGLGGVMLGLSRRTYAWTWSGHPERVEKTSS
jgi:hypothetical protein